MPLLIEESLQPLTIPLPIHHLKRKNEKLIDQFAWHILITVESEIENGKKKEKSREHLQHKLETNTQNYHINIHETI